MRRFIALLFAAFVCCLAAGTVRNAFSEEPPANEYEVKAAFLYNILQFVEWPAYAGENRSSRVNLCVIGDDPFGASIRTIDGEKTGDNKTIVVRYGRRLEGLKNCQVVLITSPEQDRVARVVASLGRAPVLTVGDTKGFAQKSVIVNFYEDRSKVRFEINVDAARRAGLKISSRLLKLARIITD
jgi:hypothetical protein